MLETLTACRRLFRFPGPLSGAPHEVGRRWRQTTSTGLQRARLCKPRCRQPEGPIFFSARQVCPVDITGHAASDHLRWPLDEALPRALERCRSAPPTPLASTRCCSQYSFGLVRHIGSFAFRVGFGLDAGHAVPCARFGTYVLRHRTTKTAAQSQPLCKTPAMAATN